MIITCSQCQAKFKIAPDQIKETGSKVRCSTCRHVFTVFRPRRQDEADELNLPASSTGLKGLDDYLNSGGGDNRADDYGLGDIFGDRPAPRPDGRDLDESYEDPEDGLDQFSDIQDEGPHLRAAYNQSDDQAGSMRERRDRRRRLYSDLADDHDLDGVPDDDGFSDDELVDEDGRPPLRRASRPAYGTLEEYEDEGGDFDRPDDSQADYRPDQASEYDEDQSYDEPAYDDQPYDDEYDDQPDGGQPEDFYQEEAGGYSYESTRLARQVSDLGLSADPVDPDKFIDDTAIGGRYGGSSPEPSSIRAAVTGPQGRSPAKLIIGLAILALILGLGIYFITSRSDSQALVDGGVSGETSGGDEGSVTGGQGGDTAGTEGITFTRGNQNHFFRQNSEAGNILIITGMVRNSYLDRRNFIRLRGHLLADDGRTLADRFVYAGNIISEDELQSLPIKEIYSRLSLKGGQDQLNMNIEPGQEIPFMLVFDKLPEGMTEYRIDPVGSEPNK